MAIKTFEELMQAAKEKGPLTVAIASAHEQEILLAARDAEELGIADCVLVGDRQAINDIARESDIDVKRMMILDEPNPKKAAHRVMELVSLGHAQITMKGKIETADFLRAALNKQYGIRGGGLLSHVGVFEIPGFDRLLFVSDAGVVVAPDMEQKVELVRNAIFVAQVLGVERPRVAILAATEMVHPKIPTTMDAANLAKMADRGQIRGGLVDGPLALDNAISVESATLKGIKSEVAGRADILITPDIEAGNLLAKAITYFAHGRMAGIVVGGRAPLVVASRSDPHETKLVSIALGVLLASK